MIICGFAGIGKSYIAKRCAKFVDLESTPFNKNWELYADVAIHMSNQGYIVLLSCHKEIRDMLKSKHVRFTVIMPRIDCKGRYITRYKNRGNTKEFIENLTNNFEKYIEEIENDIDLNILYMKDDEHLYDIQELIIDIDERTC